jgi:AcrR family transcriptional regulator
MRSIAHHAGMSVPGVYHHYHSKQELLVIILDLAMAELLWRSQAARSGGQTPVHRVALIVEALALFHRVALIVEALALFHTHRRELAFIGANEMRSLEPASRRRIVGLRNDLQHMLDDEIAQAIAEGTLTTPHPRDAARAIATMCTSLPQWSRPDGPSAPEQIATGYAQFALGLLGHQVS